MNLNTKLEPLSLIESTSAESISKALEQMTQFLISTTVEGSGLKVIGYIESSIQREFVVKEGTVLLVKGYKRIYDAVFDVVNLYKFPGSLMKRSVFEVETLLGC